MFYKSHFSDVFRGKNHIFQMFFGVKITFFGCFSGQKSHFPEFSRGEEDAITSQLNP